LRKNVEEILKKSFDERVSGVHTRLVSRIFSVIKSITLLNFHLRVKKEGVLEATEKDAFEALYLWDEIYQSQILGVPPFILELCNLVLRPLENEKKLFTLSDIQRKYFEVFGQSLLDWKFTREILPYLVNTGLIQVKPDEKDKRRKLYSITEN